jgi:hypothetical protein
MAFIRLSMERTEDEAESQLNDEDSESEEVSNPETIAVTNFQCQFRIPILRHTSSTFKKISQRKMPKVLWSMSSVPLQKVYYLS